MFIVQGDCRKDSHKQNTAETKHIGHDNINIPNKHNQTGFVSAKLLRDIKYCSVNGSIVTGLFHWKCACVTVLLVDVGSI